MITRAYSLSVESFTAIIESIGAEYEDERPNVFVYSLNKEDIYFGAKNAKVEVDASDESHKAINNAIASRA